MSEAELALVRIALRSQRTAYVESGERSTVAEIDGLLDRLYDAPRDDLALRED